MRSRSVVFLLIVSALAPSAAGAEGEADDDPDLSTVPKGGASPWFPPSGGDSSAGALAASTLWLLAWAALAGVLGLVVVSSLTKPRPVPGDPLVTAPGAPIVARRSARGAPFVAIPHDAAFESGRDLAFRASPATIEHALGLMRALGLGEASLVAGRGGDRVVRVANCSSCLSVRPQRRRRGADAAPVVACAFEQGFLAGAFETVLGREVKVDEMRCAGKPGGACEFSVRS